MRLTSQKAGYRGVVWWITHECFKGYELPESREVFEKVYENNEVFVIHGHDVVKAYALVFMGNGSVEGCYLQSIAVLPIYQKQRLGHQLMQEVFDYCVSKNERCISLHCKKDSSVVEFYKGEGYVVVKELKDKYLSDGDGLEMRIDL